MPATYEPIATTTLGSAASTITFSSIPSTYTDFRLVLVTMGTAAGTLYFRLNSDTGTNYSNTRVNGNGSTASSAQSSNYPRMDINGTDATKRNVSFSTVDFLSYTGSTNKTMLIQESHDENGSGYVHHSVGLWRNTGAITRIDLNIDGTTFASGTTATLYGILKA